MFVLAAASVDELVAEWQATSTSVSGVARGKLAVPLGDPISPLELFNRPDREDDGKD